MSVQLLVMMMGVPGSGKTHFARQLAATYPASRFNSDAIRRELWGSYEKYKWGSGDYDQKRDRVFTLLGSRVKSALAAGQSVIRDYSQNTRRTRRSGYELADSLGILALAVWVQTPLELAIQRGSNRPNEADQFRFSPEYMQKISPRSLANLEPLGDDEPGVVVDGQADFSRQYECLLRYLRSITQGEA